MIGYYNYTVILTYMSLVSSVIGMFFATGYGGMRSHPEFVLISLLVSVLCYMFDCKVGRSKKDRTESEIKFGIQIDSLCDAICFGVLPAIIGYSIGMRDWCDLPILILFPLCAVIRLAYFNVAEEERQSKTAENRKVYEGLPVTSVALILPLLYSFHKDIGDWFPEVYGGSLLVIAIAFITRFKVKKPSMRAMLCFIGVGVLELIWMLYKTKTK
ncbi:CDP-alcohol phosphatidyltransferase family protein [Ruminococcus sp.]